MQNHSLYSSVGADNKWTIYLPEAIKEGRMSESDGKLISSYLRWKMSDAGISGKRQTKLYQSLRAFRERMDCDFEQLTEASWQDAVVSIRLTEYADWTKSDIIGQTKAFIIWCVERGSIPGLPEKIVRNVKTPRAPRVTKTPDEIPTVDEVYRMLQHPTCDIQHQALIAVAYYTGMRIGEIFRLNWGDIIFNSNSVSFRIVDTKTKKYRSAPCVEPLPYIASWRRQYPAEAGVPEGNNPVFITYNRESRQYSRMEYGSANMFLRRIQKKCGLKHFGWHTFRAANITNCTMAGVPDSVIKDIHWGNQNTQMMATYVMLSDSAKESAMLKRAGIEVEEETVLSTPQNCPSCCALNGPGDQYCRLCGYPLSAKASSRQRLINEAIAYVQSHYTLDEQIESMSVSLGISKEQAKKLLSGGI